MSSGRRTRTSRTIHPSGRLLERLERAGERITEPRRLVAELVAEQDGHFTAADLVADDRAERAGVGRATVFRALDLFAGLGLVERVDLPGGEHAYVACETSHHHHAICTACGRSLDVDDLGLADILARVGERYDFAVTAHRLEVYGLCSDCRPSRAGDG
jgi:Fur family ferric uptake transcriptional regulator